MPDPRPTPDRDRVSRLLATTSPFSALPADARAPLAASPCITLSGDETVFTAGESAQSLFIIVSGEIALEIHGLDGKSLCVSSLGAGGVFGELAILDGQPRSVGARATTRSVLMSIKAATFLSLVRAHPDFALAIIRDLAGKVRRTNGQVSGLSFQTLRVRVAGLLAALTEPQSPSQQSLAMTQSELAARLGASREKVNGHLQILQSAGAIKLARGRIEIVDRGKLGRFTDPTPL